MIATTIDATLQSEAPMTDFLMLAFVFLIAGVVVTLVSQGVITFWHM